MGTVYLVGAGPGDPGLLTLRGWRVLRRADVVVHDALVDARTLAFARGAERIDVGKRRGAHTAAQDEIHRILIDAARRTRTVVRLKGGDPFIFGRGGEELVALRAAGVRCRVVPGITAALGAAASVGIPLTHRGRAGAVTFVTGHEAGFTRAAETLVIYMGVARAGAVADELMAAGLAATTPVAVVAAATLPQQRSIISTLAQLADDVARADIRAPALMVVGEVVSLEIDEAQHAAARRARLEPGSGVRRAGA